MAFHLTIPKSPTVAEIQEMADILQDSTANVVVVFAIEGQLFDLFLEVSISIYTRKYAAEYEWDFLLLLTLTFLVPILTAYA